MDYSWPVFYRLFSKTPLPRVVVAGRRYRINVSLVNELDSFRSDDIVNECPLALRVLVIPLESGEAGGKKFDFTATIQNRHVREKPHLLRGGSASMVVQISATPLPLPEGGVPFLLQVGLPPNSRIFNHVMPSCSDPMLLVSADSELGAQALSSEFGDDWSDEDEDDDDEEDENDDEADDATEKNTTKVAAGVDDANADAANGAEGDEGDEGHADEDEDEEAEIDDEDDEEEAAGAARKKAGKAGAVGLRARLAALRGGRKGQVGLGGDSDDDIIDDSDDAPVPLDDDDAAALAEEEEEDSDESDAEDTFTPNNRIYERPVTCKLRAKPGAATGSEVPEDDEEEVDEVPAVAELDDFDRENADLADYDEFGSDSEAEDPLLQSKAMHHAFVADCLTTARPAAVVAAALAADGAVSTASAAATTATAEPVGAGLVTKINTAGAAMHVAGAGMRRERALPPALLAKRQQQAQQQAEAARAAAGAAVPVPAGTDEAAIAAARAAADAAVKRGDGYTVGLRTTGAGAALLAAPSAVKLADPLSGAFAAGTCKTTTTLEQRQRLRDTLYAYVRAVSGHSIGGRVWDGAVYMMRFFNLLLQQSQGWLDGLRAVELGAGTGVVGIWLWQMIVQRASAQLKHALNAAGVPVDRENAIDEAIAELNGASPDLIESGLSPAELRVVRAMQTYGAQRPAIAVTDQRDLRHLLRFNVRVNQSRPPSMWGANLPAPAAEGWGAPWAGAPAEQRAQWTPYGLFAADADWGQQLSLPLLLLSGVRVAPGAAAKAAMSRPAADSAIAHTAVERVRQAAIDAYSNYPSLRWPTLPAEEAVAFTGFTAGLDVIIASECLYNERHFDALRTTIKDLFAAHALAHAQIADAKGAAGAVAARPFPLVLLSYRLRALDEEQKINDLFFKLFEEHGVYHTAVPMERLFPSAADNTAAADAAVTAGRGAGDQVVARLKHRREREAAIPNRLAELDAERMRDSRMAVMFQAPHKSLPATSCPPELWQRAEATGVLPSPLPLLTPNAAHLFKLFQTL
jgi:hypothetical protein